jgi:hypothetical protein
MVALLTPFATTSNGFIFPQEMKAVEKYMSDIQDISHKFDFIRKNGSEKQIFRLIKTLETGLSQKSEDLANGSNGFHL